MLGPDYWNLKLEEGMDKKKLVPRIKVWHLKAHSDLQDRFFCLLHNSFSFIPLRADI